ncbi:MAG: nucleotidyltransferase substrate binding protein [bacterium]
MKEETKLSVSKLKDAFTRLREGTLAVTDDLDRDGVIQRFEFTFELLWKSLKIFLEEEGIECRSPKECLRSALRVGLIEDEEVFLDMLEDRNRSTHTYDEKETERIFHRIKDKYIVTIENLINRIK